MSNRHDQLDELKRLIALTVLEHAEMPSIRRISLENLDRWAGLGVWCSAHDEWRDLMIAGTDDEVIAIMAGTDDKANRLRQSPPYVGLISEETRFRLLEKVGLKRPSPDAIRAAERLPEGGI